MFNICFLGEDSHEISKFSENQKKISTVAVVIGKLRALMQFT